MKLPVLLFVLCLVSPSIASPQVAPAGGTITIPRVTVPPAIDDYRDGSPRPGEVAVNTFTQREPSDGVPASQQTEAYLSYDDHHLYVIFVARDRQPGLVRASLTRREGFENDDWVGIMLDTFRDRRRAYLFIVNPLGVQLDGVNTDGEQDDYTYDTVWESQGRLTDFGYVVRIAIPFKSLRFSGMPEQEWGIGLARTIVRNNETSFWPYVTARVSGIAQQLATARGLRDISPGRNVQFIPYAAFAGARFLDAETPDYVTDADGRAGVDAKFVLKDAFTFDLTFNPDFSQVESDEPQVTINQRFEVFFPEKRPFFIENASYFETPINLFFSRRIADPQGGIRATGKSGGWALAGLAIDDRAPGRQLAPAAPGYHDRTGIAVIRAQRDLPDQSAIGLLATTRNFASDDSQVFAIDGRYRLSDTWVLTGQAAVSTTTSLDGERATGPALSLELDRTGRSWGAFFRYDDFSPDFKTTLGFVPRVDMRRFRPFVRYTWFPDRAGFVSIRPELSGGMLWDHQGTLQDWDVNSELQVELKGQTELEVGYERSMERFADVEFEKDALSFRFETAWLKWLALSAGFDRGQEINFFPSQEVRPFLANGIETDASLTLKPLAQLRIDQVYLFTRLGVRETLPIAPRGQVIVTNHIWRSRASYQFTRRLSLRAIVDYSAVLPESRLIDLEREKRFTADLLGTFMVNPWTALYVGYNDGYGNMALDTTTGELRPTDSPFHSVGRQIFVKLSYLFRL
jgi:hypothetical protein